MPLSFDWNRETLLVATPTASPTGRNLAVTRAARLALDDTRDDANELAGRDLMDDGRWLT